MTWTTRPRSELAPGIMGFVQGAGPDLLLLHGVGLRAEAWGAVIAPLAAQFRLIVVDLPGHGFSAPIRAVNAPGLSDYVQALMPLAKGAAGIIGHSFGAMLAVELAAQAQAVVAMNAIYRRAPAAAAAVRARAAELDGRAMADPSATLARWFGPMPAGALAECAAACGAWLRAADPAGYRAAYRVFAHADGPDDAVLAALNARALFLTADGDQNSTPAMAQAMAAKVRHGRARVLPGAHMLPMTDGPGVAAAIADLMRGNMP